MFSSVKYFSVFLILLMSASYPAFSIETLEKQDFSGSWFQGLDDYHFSIITLNIQDDLSGSAVRQTGPDSYQKCSFLADETKVIDDLLIITCHRESSGFFKFVLAGWKTESSAKLFGQMFMYNQEHLYNGEAVTFVRK